MKVVWLKAPEQACGLRMDKGTTKARSGTHSHTTVDQGPDYKKILRLSYDVIITYDNRKSNLR